MGDNSNLQHLPTLQAYSSVTDRAALPQEPAAVPFWLTRLHAWAGHASLFPSQQSQPAHAHVHAHIHARAVMLLATSPVHPSIHSSIQPSNFIAPSHHLVFLLHLASSIQRSDQVPEVIALLDNFFPSFDPSGFLRRKLPYPIAETTAAETAKEQTRSRSQPSWQKIISFPSPHILIFNIARQQPRLSTWSSIVLVRCVKCFILSLV